MALDEVDRLWDADGNGIHENTDFAMSVNAFDGDPTALDAGLDGIRGSNDDFHTAPEGGLPATSVLWFRKVDNDPFIVDNVPADMNNYSRSLSNLPGGHRWGASGNRRVGDALSYVDTQTVMFGGMTSDAYWNSLSADDVNMVKLARLGVPPPDGMGPYTVDLTYVGICGGAGTYDIKVTKGEIESGRGECNATKIKYTFMPGNPNLARHFSLTGGPFTVTVSDAFDWDFTVPVVFLDGFETADTSQWSDVVPAGATP